MPASRSIVFMGTPAFAVPSLRALLEAGYPVKGVFTQPDRPVGRGQQLAMPPVKEVALEAGIPVFQPQRLRGNEEALETLRQLAPDLIVVVAYGQILPESVLALPPFGCVNVHASLLPCYRGAAPIQWAVLNGDAETGVTTMLMEKGLDTGPMLLKSRTPIGQDEPADVLANRLSDLGAGLLVETLAAWFAGDLKPEQQEDAAATYAPMLKKEMALLDWSQGAASLANQVRGLRPWPGTQTTLAGEIVKVTRAAALPGAAGGSPGTLVALTDEGWEVATGEGRLLVTEVQLPGKRPTDAAAAARGWKGIVPGVRLGS